MANLLGQQGDGCLVAVIGDEDTVTGFLLTGIGHSDLQRKESLKNNFFIVNSKTTQGQIENAFRTLTRRDDVAILLINQFIANEIRACIDEYLQMIEGRPAALPTVLEIPSKTHPYDLSKDSLMTRVQGMLGVRE
uniref:V-type proton ATPase subunit F n=1 Tax=Paramoeba aestuarina TaxID=180227 RepID=A0A7S4NP61_9EUKA